jgi:hypothetical protein
LPRCRPFAEALVALALFSLATAGGEREARAAPTEAEVAQARERFSAARKLEDAGRWADALSLLQRVAEVKMTPQVRFHVALCLENVGLWTQALDGYAQAAGEAGAAADVLKEANEHLHKLEAAIPTVSLSVEGAAAGDELLLDRRRLPLDEGPLPIRADPGPHTAEVRRGGAVLAREYFALDPRSTRRVELRIGSVAPDPGHDVALSPTPPAAPIQVPSAAAAHEPAVVAVPASPGPAEPAPGSTQRALGWTGVGVGAASVVLTGIFIGLRGNEMSQLSQACPSFTQCAPSVAAIVSDGKTDAALVNVFGVIGGVAAAAGVVALVTAPITMGAAPRSPAAPLSTAAWLELRGDGRFAVRGIF